jgi:hypothetical protein
VRQRQPVLARPDQTLSPALLPTALFSAEIIIFWLSEDATVTRRCA